MKKDLFARLGRFIGSVAAMTIFASITAIITAIAIRVVRWILFL